MRLMWKRWPQWGSWPQWAPHTTTLPSGRTPATIARRNAVYDEIVGRVPSRLSRLNLAADLADALAGRGIRLLVYLPSGAPSMDVLLGGAARLALGFRKTVAIVGRRGDGRAAARLPGSLGGGDPRMVTALGAESLGLVVRRLRTSPMPCIATRMRRTSCCLPRPPKPATRIH